MNSVTYEYTAGQRRMVDLYRVLRLAAINKRYYGERAASAAKAQKTLRIVSAVGSAVTAGGLLAGFPGAVLFVTSVAGLASTLVSLLGLSERVTRFEKLHFAYAQLESQCNNVAFQAKDHGTVTEHHAGMVAAIHDQWDRLSALDEPKPNQERVDRIAEEIAFSIPVDRLWMPEE